MFLWRKRKIPVNSAKKNTCGVSGDGNPISKTDVRDLVKDGLLEQVPMNEEQKAATKKFMRDVKSI